MTISEMAVEYRQSGETCRRGLEALLRKMESEELTDSRRLELRREITVVSAMARDAIAISNYLRDYYGRGNNSIGANSQRAGVSGAEMPAEDALAC